MAIHGYPGQIINALRPTAFSSAIWTLTGLSKAYNSVVQVFTATDTWVCPVGVTSVEYLVVAGGGGGGDVTGGGGGGGGFRTGTGLAVIPSTSYTITVGAGGAISGGNGVDSSIGSPASIT